MSGNLNDKLEFYLSSYAAGWLSNKNNSELIAELSENKRQVLARLIRYELERDTRLYEREVYCGDFCEFDPSLSKLSAEILNYRVPNNDLANIDKKIIFDRDANQENLDINILKKYGYTVSNQILSAELRSEVIRQIEDCTFINRGVFDVELSGNHIMEAINDNNLYKFTGVNGDTFWVKDQNQLAQKEIFQKLAFDPYILSVVSGYLGCVPIHVQTNFWFSFPTFKNTNNLSANGQMFHQDREFAKFIKIFIYMNNVDDFNGPHVYVEGSHVDEAHTYGIPLTERISDAAISNIYDPKRIKKLIGPAGTIAFGDTTCVHKGEALISGYRMMLQLEYASSLYLSPICPFSDQSALKNNMSHYSKEVSCRLLSNYSDRLRGEFLQSKVASNRTSPPWRKVAQLIKRYLVN